jgi:RNA-binding protein 39
VFVQQLAGRLRTHELAKFFSKVGPVKEAQIVKDRVSGRSKGVGYVEFKDEESVAKALELTGQRLASIPIIVQLTEAEKNRQARQVDGHGGPNSGIPFHRLYVGNIHFSISEADLEEVFKPFGELEFVQLQKEEGGRSKGYGFVQFHNAADAKTALDEMNGFEIAGRPIRVGLGNDKFTPESTQNLLRSFNSNFQGSSFSGAGGRGAQAGGAGGTFDRAIARETDRGTGGASALDDTDVAGVNFNNYSRESLMMKLARRDPSTMESLPALNVIASSKKPADYVGFKGPSRCIKVEDVFNPDTETDPNWVEDIEEEIKTECETKWGKVLHIKLDPNSREGEVWIMFEKEESAAKAMQGLDGRLYNHGHHLRASPISEHIYRSLYGRALSKVL